MSGAEWPQKVKLALTPAGYPFLPGPHATPEDLERLGAPTETYVPIAGLHAEAERLESANLEGDGPADLTAATVRAVKAQGIRDAIASLTQPCETCGGRKEVDWTFGNPSPKVPCPDCRPNRGEDAERLREVAETQRDQLLARIETLRQADSIGKTTKGSDDG